MNKIKSPIQVTKFRKHLSDYFEASWKEPLLITSARSWSRVFLNLDDYNKLVEDAKTQTNIAHDDSWNYCTADL